MSLVTISASYGAGGSQVGPAVAERLGVPFVDRAIPFAVADRLAVPVEEALANDEEQAPGLVERVLRAFAGQDSWGPVPTPAPTTSPDDFHAATEEFLRRQAATGEGVILGRAAAHALRDDPRILRVRLDGPREARVGQAMRLGGIERTAAERALRHNDAAHAAYVRRFYGADLRDPAHYHVVLDTTAIDLDDCVEAIVGVARARSRVGASP